MFSREILKYYLPSIAIILSSFNSICMAVTNVSNSPVIVRDSETFLSNGKGFKLGFFSPVNTSSRYVGIWYSDIPEITVIWVANRERPLNDRSGRVVLAEDGNIVVTNRDDEIFWSSNFSNIARINTSIQLLDSGNLILLDNSTGQQVWDSFSDPSNTFLPKMRLTHDMNTGEEIRLKSWRSPSDPTDGNFTVGLVALNIPQVVIWDGNRKHWRSGPWNGQIFIGVEDMASVSVYKDGVSVVNDNQGVVYFTGIFGGQNLSRFHIDSEGTLFLSYWDEQPRQWNIFWLVPRDDCDEYGMCGPFGVCNSRKSPICSCLGGYVARNTDEWGRGNWTRGCVRRTPLQCERRNETAERSKEDGFLRLKMMKVPDFSEWSSANWTNRLVSEECKTLCMRNCSCTAYAYDAGIGCMWWNGDLIDLQQFNVSGTDLYIRVAYTDLDKKKDTKIFIIIPVIVGSLFLLLFAICVWRWRVEKRGSKKEKKTLLHMMGEADSPENMLGDDISKINLEELPLFSFEIIENATDKFNLANKLGQGGFGPVYKGKLEDGKEIAVKRLSRASGQGLKEFINEAVVISKLQHRNLVKLLGCCIDREEKILVYEFMPNKSLDVLLFNPQENEVLDWKKRFNIIEGTGRGLLYLHRDSRLKIIHRDLKPSNILLDKSFNPKISDFGMAKIFGGTEDQANTRRVVGTYGYMAPEYAMEGLCSEKSDVFSFGVLVLEIVSGRKNTSFYYHDCALSLLGYAWKLWSEDNILSLIDPVISKSAVQVDIIRCIHIGLLCVQESAKHRPSVSAVLSMLNCEIADLPQPKQPAFTERQSPYDSSTSQQSNKRSSQNHVTLTAIEGR